MDRLTERYIFLVTRHKGRFSAEMPGLDYSDPSKFETIDEAIDNAWKASSQRAAEQKPLEEILDDDETSLRLSKGSFLILIPHRTKSLSLQESTTELLEAAKALLPYLEASTDSRDRLVAIRTATPEEDRKAVAEAWKRDEQSPADRLRKQADEMEAKDAVIKRFRAAVEAAS